MVLPNLATAADLAARGVVVDSAEEPVAEALLGIASAVVREAAGSPIIETTSTVTLPGNGGTRLVLPGLPTTAVVALAVNDVPVSDWTLRTGAVVRDAGFARGAEISVTYTHGLPAVPADIVDLVCRMAARGLSAYRSGDPAAKPVIQERIGDYSVTYGYDVSYSDMELPKYLRARLAARFGASVAGVTSR
ncbi:hypothetical protein [Actinacidiphila sp. bgisy167]|uniref:hypothetical protein n=1 Tax=Actinacidiphila sp. bgisy167 TaxID=3413797 RepID=UPI003D754D40